jgi:hypothetical protein
MRFRTGASSSVFGLLDAGWRGYDLLNGRFRWRCLGATTDQLKILGAVRQKVGRLLQEHVSHLCIDLPIIAREKGGGSPHAFAVVERLRDGSSCCTLLTSTLFLQKTT